MKNWEENVFQGIPVGADEAGLLDTFLKAHDFVLGTRRGIVLDLRKLARWFTQANREPFVVGRVTTRDITDFRDHLRREKGQAVATVNRTLVMAPLFRLAGRAAQNHCKSGQAGEGATPSAACAEGPRPQSGPPSAP